MQSPARVTLNIDTHRLVVNLKKAGFSEKQAESLLEEIKQIELRNVASKDDLNIAIAAVKDDIAELKAETKDDIAALKFDLIKWMVTLLFANSALVVTLLKLF